MEQPNISEHYQKKISYLQRVRKNKHKSLVISFSGLPFSGKSAIARQTEIELFENNFNTYFLDIERIKKYVGAEIDMGSVSGRKEYVERIGHICELLLDACVIVLIIQPFAFEQERILLKEYIGQMNFFEIFVDCPIEECKKRDYKGLYQQAENNEIKNFPGINIRYEEPESPDLVINSDKETIDESVERIIHILKEKILI
ncbi:MAG: adenylyl-sulfate kinase [Chitinophagaceae bacterium]|nr:adenylyl-sulfate kinase [Chitinophagaceae bacterium]